MSDPTPWRRDPKSAAGRLLDEARAVRPWPVAARRATWERIERTAGQAEGARSSRARIAWAVVAVAAVVAGLVAIRPRGPQPAAPSTPMVALAPPAPTRAPAAVPAAQEPEPMRLGGATIQPRPDARVRRLAPHRLALDSGRVEATATGERLEVDTPWARVLTRHARFAVLVDRATATVQVLEGSIELRARNGHSVTVEAGDTIRSDDARLAVPLPSAAAPPAPTRAQALDDCLRREVAARRDCLSALAGGDNLAAEVATYTLARDDDGAAAIARLHEYARRFPRGSFAPEAQLRLVELLARGGDRAAAKREADAFFARFPSDPRAARLRDHY